MDAHSCACQWSWAARSKEWGLGFLQNVLDILAKALTPVKLALDGVPARVCIFLCNCRNLNCSSSSLHCARRVVLSCASSWVLFWSLAWGLLDCCCCLVVCRLFGVVFLVCCCLVVVLFGWWLLRLLLFVAFVFGVSLFSSAWMLCTLSCLS